MSQSAIPAQKRQAFTLVELLVVIGIIALLISILLPSLAKARQTAVQVQCAANLRQVGAALFMYNNDFKKIPAAWEGGSMWAFALAPQLGGVISGGSGVYSPKVLQCPDAMAPKTTGIDGAGAGGWWGRVNMYSANPRLVVQLNDADGANGGKPVQRRSLESVRNASDKAIAWDGPHAYVSWEANSFGMAYPDNRNLDGNSWWGNHRFIDPPPTSYNTAYMDMPPTVGENGYHGTNLATAISTIKQYNQDLQNYTKCMMRYRHKENTSMNVLYVDGHVEGKAIGEFKRKELCVNLQK